MEKKCPRCEQTKPLDEFNKSRSSKNGHQATCRPCANEYQAVYRSKSFYKKRKAEYVAQYRKRHPEKIKAQLLVKSALRAEKMKRQPCIVCGEKKSEAHHPDYNKPLDVMWLCHKHHMEQHRKERENDIGEEGRGTDNRSRDDESNHR